LLFVFRRVSGGPDLEVHSGHRQFQIAAPVFRFNRSFATAKVKEMTSNVLAGDVVEPSALASAVGDGGIPSFG